MAGQIGSGGASPPPPPTTIDDAAQRWKQGTPTQAAAAALATDVQTDQAVLDALSSPDLPNPSSPAALNAARANLHTSQGAFWQAKVAEDKSWQGFANAPTGGGLDPFASQNRQASAGALASDQGALNMFKDVAPGLGAYLTGNSATSAGPAATPPGSGAAATTPGAAPTQPFTKNVLAAAADFQRGARTMADAGRAAGLTSGNTAAPSTGPRIANPFLPASPSGATRGLMSASSPAASGFTDLGTRPAPGADLRGAGGADAAAGEPGTAGGARTTAGTGGADASAGASNANTAGGAAGAPPALSGGVGSADTAAQGGETRLHSGQPQLTLKTPKDTRVAVSSDPSGATVASVVDSPGSPGGEQTVANANGDYIVRRGPGRSSSTAPDGSSMSVMSDADAQALTQQGRRDALGAGANALGDAAPGSSQRINGGPTTLPVTVPPGYQMRTQTGADGRTGVQVVASPGAPGGLQTVSNAKGNYYVEGDRGLNVAANQGGVVFRPGPGGGASQSTAGSGAADPGAEPAIPPAAQTAGTAATGGPARSGPVQNQNGGPKQLTVQVPPNYRLDVSTASDGRTLARVVPAAGAAGGAQAIGNAAGNFRLEGAPGMNLSSRNDQVVFTAGGSVASA